MENCFFRLSDELKNEFADKDVLYHLVKSSDEIYIVEYLNESTKLVEESRYEAKDVEKYFSNGAWVAVSLEKDENKPCWNCKQLDELGGCKLYEGVCPVWIEADETDNFKCFEK